VDNFLNLIKTFNWHNPTWDVFILGAWVLASVFYAFAAGRGRVVNILISIYIAKLLVLQAPFLTGGIAGKLPEGLAALQGLVAFGAIFLVLFLLLGRYVFKTSADHRQISSMLFGLLFSFLQIGLLINIVLNYLPQELQNNFSPLIQAIFIQQYASFVWLVLPVIYLILMGKFVGDSNEV
jgi:hypothetical protein